ncbi:hypothetical protein HWV07_09825 [Natronomonas salina]|uniref:hypothetical protein n=1 Tax=Natronomonas salina TaxID=1710540 RepID=UPI0015B4E20D|nr:hypothetical protein [Natronomonas salina]QLD89309.1 hypothetical protein HWV07_09825 [Natronomonas salina]
MSTEPTPTPDTEPTTETPPTEIAARTGDDPWAAADETPGDLDRPTTAAQQLFDPYSVARLRNLMDDENAYCS